MSHSLAFAKAWNFIFQSCEWINCGLAEIIYVAIKAEFLKWKHGDNGKQNLFKRPVERMKLYIRLFLIFISSSYAGIPIPPIKATSDRHITGSQKLKPLLKGAKHTRYPVKQPTVIVWHHRQQHFVCKHIFFASCHYWILYIFFVKVSFSPLFLER